MRKELIRLTSGGITTIPSIPPPDEFVLSDEAWYQMKQEAWGKFGRLTAKNFQAYCQWRNAWITKYREKDELL